MRNTLGLRGGSEGGLQSHSRSALIRMLAVTAGLALLLGTLYVIAWAAGAFASLPESLSAGATFLRTAALAFAVIASGLRVALDRGMDARIPSIVAVLLLAVMLVAGAQPASAYDRGNAAPAVLYLYAGLGVAVCLAINAALGLALAVREMREASPN